MNTLEEISSSIEANHAFWTQRARFNLACYRENRKCGFSAAATLEKVGFRKAIKSRRERVYFDG